MKISPKDWLFLSLIGAVLAFVFMISGKETTKKVPFDETHRPMYEVLRSTGSKVKAEQRCEGCHNGTKIPFPKDHPPKNRCLFCHKMAQPAP
jgi:hypothetical protein